MISGGNVKIPIHHPKKSLFRRITTALVAALVAAPASAEPAESAAPSRLTEVIIVTAEKREESILDVPLTVTAFNDQMIEQLGMTNKFDLEQMVPGLQFGDDNEKNGHGTVIRGIGSRVWGELHKDLAVATYVDGVYTHVDAGVAPNLFDVERVEVARGPQGTLHGRNSIAGAISYVSKKPTDEWDLEVLTEVTDQFTQRYDLAFGGPLTDNLSFRIAAGYFEGDGAQKNIGLGDDYDAPDEYSYAPKLRFKTDRLDVNVGYSFTRDTGSPSALILLRDPPRDQPWLCVSDTTPSWLPGGLPYDAFNNVPEADALAGGGELNGVPFVCEGDYDEIANEWYLHNQPAPAIEDCPDGIPPNLCGNLKNEVNLNRPGIQDTSRESWTLNADLKVTDALTLRYTYGWSEIDEWYSRDGDFTNRVPSAADQLLAADGGVPFIDSRINTPFFNDQSSHELQLISNYDGPFNFIVGLFTYENFTDFNLYGENFSNPLRFTNSDEQAQLLGYADCNDLLGDFLDEEDLAFFDCPSGNNHIYEWAWLVPAFSETRAAFASLDYRFNEEWALSGGVRWTEDKKFREINWTEWYLEDFDGVLVRFSENSAGDSLFGQGAGGAGTGVSGRVDKPTWDALIWNVSLEHTPNDHAMLYGRISTGYRAGGLPGDQDPSLTPVEEETLINFEAGVKGRFFDQRLTLLIAAFRNDYDGFQLEHMINHPSPETINPFSTPVLSRTTNIDGTSIWGVELEGSYYINERWRLSGFYAYLGSEIGAFKAIVGGDPSPNLAPWEVLDWDTGETKTTHYPLEKTWDGTTLPMQPEHKAAGTLTYVRPLDGNRGTLELLGTASWSGEKFPQAQNIEEQVIPAYSRVDLRGTWTSADEQWAVTVYVQNVLDEIGLVEFQPRGGNGGSGGLSSFEIIPPIGKLTEPRQFGLQARWRPQL